nr:MAG TPA: hypothetical protein [Caudoviricetes sp.]
MRRGCLTSKRKEEYNYSRSFGREHSRLSRF